MINIRSLDPYRVTEKERVGSVQGSETATYSAPKFLLIPYSDSTGREASEYIVWVLCDTALNHNCDPAEVATIFTIFAILATDFQCGIQKFRSRWLFFCSGQGLETDQQIH